MSAKLIKSTQKIMENLTMNDADKVLDDKLPIVLNGNEKYATGLTKRTTVDDVIFAMLSVSDASFMPEHLSDYGIVEKWQGNERILDGKIKIYKLIRLWKSLPGDQLSQVKFIIKKRKQNMKLSARDTNMAEKPVLTKESKNKFAFCTFSPAMSKTWNAEKAERSNAIKASFAQRQLATENTFLTVYSSSSEQSDVDSDLNSESSDETNTDNNKLVNHKRYASIKRFNRSRKSSVKQIKKSFIDLVTKQNEIIDKQLDQISETNTRSKGLAKFLRGKSGDKSAKVKSLKHIDIDENDIKQAFCNGANALNLDDKQAKEYSKLCKDYFKLQHCLNSKLQRIEDLKTELNEISSNTSVSEKKTEARLVKTNKKLQSTIETTNTQSEKLNDMSIALNKIDDIISLKEKFIQSLEKELQQLDSNEETVAVKKSLVLTSETARSSTSSTSSVFTSISSISTSQYANMNSNANAVKFSQNQMSGNKFSYADNESDTGISSANSEEFNTHLETLV